MKNYKKKILFEFFIPKIFSGTGYEWVIHLKPVRLFRETSCLEKTTILENS